MLVCLIGPTAAGKTPLAVDLVQKFPFEIISVDSAMVYRGMDIGTAKPDLKTRQIAPHRLIDILDPAEHYSAGQFRADALREIEDIIAHEKIPLLVGGTMMYFRALQQGIAPLPSRDVKLRAALQEQGERDGWETLHQTLMTIDPEAAKRIHPNDSQRIQRSLEVFMLTGKTISEQQTASTNPLSGYHVINIAIAPKDRKNLHEKITLRFQHMLEQGFLEEVQRLHERDDLNPHLPSIRSVGYRQLWDYLDNKLTFAEMCEKVITATRQLAKRQMTWLRSWDELQWFESEDQDLFSTVAQWLNHQGIK